MKTVLMVMCSLMSLYSLSAQTMSSRPKLNYRGRSYEDYFLRTLRYPTNLREACVTRVAFTTITFQIDEQGTFALLTVEGSVSDSIKAYLKTEFAQTSGHWAIATANDKPVRSKVYVQPILFQPSSGCNYLADYDKSINLLITAARKKQIVLDLWHVIGSYDDSSVGDSTGMFNK